MATPFRSLFGLLLLLVFLSSSRLMYLSLLSDSPLSPRPPPLSPRPPPLSPSCGLGRSWAVRLSAASHPGGEDGPVILDVVADKVARQVGLENQGQIGQLEGHYLMCAAEPRLELGAASREDKRAPPGDLLAAHPRVLWHSQDRVLSRSKRSLAFNDPNYPNQWHLHNNLSKGMDINVTGLWERNITGTGVTVVVVDDGVEHTLKDIQPNYSPEGSYDLNSNDPDPMPHPDAHSDNHHGTRCAGEIAAVPNNSFCAVGVAYGSKVAGIRVLDGPLTDSMEAVAFNKHYQVNDIYSCSWGPDDDGHTVDGPHPLGKAALQHGVIAGRRGFGSVFVVASGNGGQYNDNCNYDGYANSIYTITIGAVDEKGQMPFYAEECASMLAVTFSSGGTKLRSIVTSDWSMLKGTGCTDGHTGTSAAAPLAAGMVALMLQVRPCLTWRDVQHIITFTATKYDDHADWRANGAGFHHSHKHGFGLLNAWRMVNAAKVWESVPFLLSYQSPVLKEEVTILTYPDKLTRTCNVTSRDLSRSGMQTLEHVSVTVTIRHPCRGNVEVVLVCPSGMSSLIGARRVLDRALGEYKLLIVDHKEPSSKLCVATGTLAQWKLTLLVEEAMGGRYLDNGFSLPCAPGQEIAPEMVTPFSSNNLKFLLLLGCFAFFWSLYYTLEVVLAHLDLQELLCLRRKSQGGSRGGRGRGRSRGFDRVSVEDGEEEVQEEEQEEEQERDSGMEHHAVLDFKANAQRAAT
ncbi:hypothetical protein NHX12_009408 [Muraenolepis orangiensis]|uniref:P/Homo B domain-containing protein n=1 Tax=Muraenolepis orangiensis TaxID=630683 RepID=A0A9Q0IB57_9TELE|nr:hypothetical protein NHX12_009408 [Muraenolepis orangiensis]